MGLFKELSGAKAIPQELVRLLATFMVVQQLLLLNSKMMLALQLTLS